MTIAKRTTESLRYRLQVSNADTLITITSKALTSNRSR